MDMFGRVGLVEIPILIAPDQKTWLDRMITEGKIRYSSGRNLGTGFTLLHVHPNAVA